MKKKYLIFGLLIMLVFVIGVNTVLSDSPQDVLPGNWEFIDECRNVTYYVEEQITLYIPCPEGFPFLENESHISCEDAGYPIPYSWTNLTANPYIIEECEHIGIRKKNGEQDIYYAEGESCLATGSVFCCWKNQDGGIHLDNRPPQYRIIIRGGESGKCVNIQTGMTVLSGRSDFGEMLTI